MSFFVQSLKHRLLNEGVYVSKPTAAARLASFFSRIKPVSTHHGLIRVGGDADGGYLIPDDLEGIEYCFSPGVSNVAEFERDLVGRGIKCFLADYSVPGPPFENALIDFERKFLGTEDTDVFMRLDGWVKRKAPLGTDLILQMDVEGAEYELILDSSRDTLKQFRIIVIEFHALDAIFHPFGLRLIEAAFDKLLQDFAVTHIHPNNCASPKRYVSYSVPPVIEISLLRRDRIGSTQPTRTFPHPLDRANERDRPDLVLPYCWYAPDHP